MKKSVFALVLGLGMMSFVYLTLNVEKEQQINWMSLEEAVQANKKAKKKLFIDVYTDWCKWCKVMDQQTFTDPTVIQFMNKNFYAVKLNAEQKEAIEFKGKTYNYVKAGRSGINELAYTLLKGRPSYPSYVYLDEQLNPLGVTAGFKKPDAFLIDMKTKAAKASNAD